MATRPHAPILLVLSSPSGAGKTTLSRWLMAQDAAIDFSVSLTTRPPRSGEREGVDYHFTDTHQFEQLCAQGELLEHSRPYTHAYGTPAAPVREALAAGRDMLFELDAPGMRALRAAYPQQVVSVFILPPSLDELARRLQARGLDDPHALRRRTEAAREEILSYHDYDYVLVNADLDTSQLQLRALVLAERLRRTRQPHLAHYVESLLDGDSSSSAQIAPNSSGVS